MSATICTSSRQRWNESQASPLGSRVPDAGSCSQAHQSLLTLPPSIWCAAVATPQVKPAGNVSVPSGSAGDAGGIGRRVAGVAPVRSCAVSCPACDHGQMSTSLELLVDLLDLEPI